MALSGFLFICLRIVEFVTLIPVIGMLSWFVDGFNSSNLLTPNYILVLFIVSVLAGAWALFTLIGYARTRHSGLFVALVDLLFVGALIGGVVELRGIAHENCSNFSAGSFYVSLGPFGEYGRQSNSPWAASINKPCAMLKASFAFAIMNIIFFFTTFVSSLSPTTNLDYVGANDIYHSSWPYSSTDITNQKRWSSSVHTTALATARGGLHAVAVGNMIIAPAAVVARTTVPAGDNTMCRKDLSYFSWRIGWKHGIRSVATRHFGLKLSSSKGRPPIFLMSMGNLAGEFWSNSFCSYFPIYHCCIAQLTRYGLLFIFVSKFSDRKHLFIYHSVFFR